MDLAIFAAGLFIFVAHLLELLFQKTRIPDILLLMLLGVIIGPGGFGVLDPDQLGAVGEFLSATTLVVLLCASGLSLKFKVLLNAAKRATPFALVSMFGAVALMALLLIAFLGLEPWMGILGGFILGGTSSAVVIPMITSLNASEESTTLLTVESALTDVLCIIGTVGIATALQKGDGVSAGNLLGTTLVAFFGAALFGIATALLWAYTISVIDRMKGAMHTTLAYALLVYGAAQLMGVSGAIAALVFGITLGNLPEDLSLSIGKRKISFKPVSETEKAVYAEVVFLLKAFFFFYLGLRVMPTEFFSGAGIVALLLALVPFIPRLPAVRFILNRKTTDRREALLAWALVPRGLAAAVLAQIPVQFGLPGAETLAGTVAMAVFLSITAVAVCVMMIENGKLEPMGNALFSVFPETTDGSSIEVEAEDVKTPQAIEHQAVPAIEDQTQSEAPSNAVAPPQEDVQDTLPSTPAAPETAPEKTTENAQVPRQPPAQLELGVAENNTDDPVDPS